MNGMKSSFSREGFTLIELLVVIAILGILSAVVLVAIDPGARLAAARDVQRKADLRQIANALDAYYVEHEEYPIRPQSESEPITCGRSEDPNETRCASAVTDTWHNASLTAALDVLISEGYLKVLPIDPLNTNFTSVWQNEATGAYSYFYSTSADAGGTPGQYYFLGCFLENTGDSLALGQLAFRPFWPNCSSSVGFDSRLYLIRSYRCDGDPEGSQ